MRHNPLFALLFAIFIEPLAAAIWQSMYKTYNTGIQTKHFHHKNSIYADEILLYLTNTSTALPEVFKSRVHILKKFRFNKLILIDL